MPELTKEQRDKLKVIYEELKAIEGSLNNKGNIHRQVVQSYHSLLQDLDKITGENYVSGFMNYVVPYLSEDQEYCYSREPFKTSVHRLIANLRTKYNLEEDKIVGIGNIIQIIQDEELKNRCIDLLSAKENFDRVIREATTILENRIRILADPKLNEVGVDLVDKVLNPKRGMLTLDGEPNEQEGFYQLYGV